MHVFDEFPGKYILIFDAKRICRYFDPVRLAVQYAGNFLLENARGQKEIPIKTTQIRLHK